MAWAQPSRAASIPYPTAAETVRSALLQAQLALADDTAAAQAAWQSAADAYAAQLAGPLAHTAPEADARARAGLDEAAAALAQGDAARFAAARAQVWTALLAGSYQTVTAMLQSGDGEGARAWLPLREFRHATRFSRPNTGATLALRDFALGAIDAGQARQTVQADLLDTYQTRLTEALADVRAADAQQFAVRRAEAAALAEGYFAILTPAYTEQRGQAAARSATAAFADLHAVAAQGTSPAATLIDTLAEVDAALHGFRAAPLSPAEQKRRAGQMLRFLSLVPVEYGRGVRNGQVTIDLEIREAITFGDFAALAFADLRDLLEARDAAATEQIAQRLAELNGYLQAAGAHTQAAKPAGVRALTQEIVTALTALMPPEWGKQDSDADFDVVAAALDQMEAALAEGDYARAESARVEAYAVLESGPEARLTAFAPQYITPIEELFWYGQGEQPGLAYLIQQRASAQEVAGTRQALDGQLAAAQTALGGQTSPFAVATNAALIVFREGLEAVVILAALMASLVGGDRLYRRPMAWGVLLAFVATAATWWVAQQVITSFSRYGERLEAIVSLIAIAVLLLITNWFFHRVYWKEWMATFHARKKSLLAGAALGQMAGFVLLGFSSVYREGFETVLFLQALVLESSVWRVLQGTLLGLLGVFLVGYMTFSLQSRLPYKRLLVGTGVLIGAVLLMMVGNTAHALQIVGWMPIHPIRTVTLPYWWGLWFGVYATWEGVSLQILAAVFVLGSYFLAESRQRQMLRRKRRLHTADAPLPAYPSHMTEAS
ncbi:MAG: FTR1 family protein [Caldilineaceae bacterium]|nr:FTR1 family protein [Caldilineaceae bacterium]